MAFYCCYKLVFSLNEDDDPQCARFIQWINEVLKQRKENLKDLSLQRRKLQYYTQQQAKGVRVLSKHLKREVTQEDIDKVRVRIGLSQAAGFLLQTKATYLNSLVKNYLKHRAKKGPYVILGYALPAMVYEVYNQKINDARRA